MKISIAKLLLVPAVALFLTATSIAQVRATATASVSAPTSAPAAEAAKPAADAPATDAKASKAHGSHHDSIIKIQVDDEDHAQNSVVAIGHDALLEAGKQADAVVAIFGSATSEGEVSQAVVSLFGDSRATGTVGDSVVAVMGDVYVDSKVGDSVVAVMGNVELGPHADVGGDLSTVGGKLIKDPNAQIHGSVSQVELPGNFTGLAKIRSWITHCLMLGRPLAFERDLGWAWSIAAAFLVLYLLMALLFHRGVDRTVSTLETNPGTVTLTALISLLLLPVLLILLCVTVIGIPLIPFLMIAWWLAGLFGTCVLLAWIGRLVIRAVGHRDPVPAFAGVLVGSAIILLLYTVPVVGFIVYKLVGLLGRAAVLVTLAQMIRASRSGKGPSPQAVPPPATTAAPAAAEPAAASFAEHEGAPAATAEPAAASTAPAAAAIIAPAAPRAGFWIRIAALLVDGIIIGVVLSLLGHHDAHNLWLLGMATYGAVMWKLKGTTIGGVLCNLQIVRLDGRPVDWGTSIIRALSCFLSLVVVGLGFIWIAIDRDRQAWHDKIAGTVVVRPAKSVSLV